MTRTGGSKRARRLAWLAAWTLLLGACGQDRSAPGPSAGKPEAADAGAVDSGAEPGDASRPLADVGAEPQDAGPSTTGGKLALESVDPSSGKAGGGYPVTLYGAAFEPDVQILVDGVPVDADTVFFVDATELQITMPPHAPGLASIEVIVPGPNPPQTTRTTKLHDVFLYYNDVVIAKVDPAEGPVGGGTPITISGTGFAGGTTVLIGGKPAIGTQVVADDELVAITPPGLFGAQPVHVLNSGGTAVLKKGFFYFDPPIVQAVAPAAGPLAGGTEAVVRGENFTAQTEVWIGDAQASVLGWEGAGRLRIATPPGSPGPAEVRATTKYGAGKLLGGFVYTDDKGTAATRILSIAPAKGPVGGGQTVTLVALGLTGKDDTTVVFGDKLATLLEVDPVHHGALVRTPAGKAGPADVRLLTSKGSATAKAGFTYVQAVRIASITPAFGPPSGNTKVVLKGEGFAKGKPSVRIGALPAKTVVLVSDSEIQAITPPGSPGYVHVTVEVAGDKAVLHNGFAYSGDQLGLHVAYPDSGSRAGGTRVHIYGNGFVKGAEVMFGAALATHLTFLDPTHLTVKTPPGKVGAVDVSVLQKGAKVTLKGGYTYFNPMSKYGGTWGAEVDGILNLTVLDASNGKPVPDAFTMLWTDPSTPHQGFTDAHGQITFSGDDVLGVQMISASKPKYESASVIEFNATNVTLYINPIPDPSPGSPPAGPPAPMVSGRVIGLDKYVIIPAGSCNEALSPTNPKKPASPHCKPCSSKASCGGIAGFACLDLGGLNGKRCAADCSLGQACPTGFFCQPQKVGGPRCVPQAGELAAVCYHSKPNFLSRDNWPPVGPAFEANPANGFEYTINTNFGEMAIVCFGGYKKLGSKLSADDAQSMFNFTPTTMGVRRHLFVGPAANPKLPNHVKGIDLKLNIPLSRRANLRFDTLHKWPVAPSEYIFSFARAYLSLGSDGVMTLLDLPQQLYTYGSGSYTNPKATRLRFEHLPAAFVEEIFDASLTFLGMEATVSGGKGSTPMAAAVLKDVKDLNNDAMIYRQGHGDFETIATGVARTIYGLWGSDKLSVYGVGAKGAVFAWSGNGWTQQANFTTEDLHAVHGSDASHVWAVGDKGAAARFDGMSWQVVPVAESSKVYKDVNFRGVFVTADPGDGSGAKAGQPEVWLAGNRGLYRAGQVGGAPAVKRYLPYISINARALHGTDGKHIWAVGYGGRIVFWDGKVWKQQDSGTSIGLNGIWAASPQAAWAVGEAGIIRRFTGLGWLAEKSPTAETLQAVWGNSEQDVWAVGTAGAVIHYDGTSWKKVGVKELHKSLHAVWAAADGTFYSMGAQELLLGPMIYPPMPVMPKKNGKLVGNTLSWSVDPNSTQPHFNYVTLGIPGMGGDTPVWNIMAAGDLTRTALPDFPKIQGTPGIPQNTTLHLTMIRGYKPGFDIDAYDLSDLNTLTWQSWAVNSIYFTKP